MKTGPLRPEVHFAVSGCLVAMEPIYRWRRWKGLLFPARTCTLRRYSRSSRGVEGRPDTGSKVLKALDVGPSRDYDCPLGSTRKMERLVFASISVEAGKIGGWRVRVHIKVAFRHLDRLLRFFL